MDSMRALLEHWRTRHDWRAAERMLNGWNPSRTRIDGLDIDFAHVRLPTLPDFGFSAAPAEPGWGITRTAAAWEVFMARLGHERWGAQGGDLGSAVTEDHPLTLPTGITMAPGDVMRKSRRWAERRFPNIVHFGRTPAWGHFAGWERPGHFVHDVRATFSGLR
ncbi:epoxide hydrolase N-terminal domain-containing protein [Lentzea sp. HUAS12]|uniref:epoxide hydrolase N-terminal domain-containing protein n=1 Tax=Lentzea sp. HUAS12 TaxID=2951806 RepID=UPI00209EED6A|nr:epoxide hydrolase N-terminal domain-containing protein [Lentzea sp. HUAS12]USX53651.1 epoxide hydrolase N-terminal domain-containing protein [Lentzea sp. HUAS12]